MNKMDKGFWVCVTPVVLTAMSALVVAVIPPKETEHKDMCKKEAMVSIPLVNALNMNCSKEHE